MKRTTIVSISDWHMVLAVPDDPDPRLHHIRGLAILASTGNRWTELELFKYT
jgi:hypothetical protein